MGSIFILCAEDTKWDSNPPAPTADRLWETFTFLVFITITPQGPVVQSIVSLTSSLRGQLVKCFTTL